jgi:AcrR family transcriptional regulator
MPASFRGAACTPAQAATNSALAATLPTDLNMFKLQLDRRGTASYSLNMFKDAGRAVPQRAASEETRRQILETALALFRERGFEDTTLRDIAREAELSLGAAYYYFHSKEAIVGAYYDYVQAEHLRRARDAFARGGSLKERLRAALHTKIDIMQGDRRLLRALFRYGGEPAHPLSWFGPATRDQRLCSIDVFAEALAGEKLPDDVREAAPTLLWTLHMGVLLYFLYDDSPGQRRTRKLIDASVDFTVDVKRLATSALLRPLRRRVMNILRDAGLLSAAGTTTRAANAG